MPGGAASRQVRTVAGLRRAQLRLHRLEAIFGNDDAIDRVMRRGRYMHLCAVIGRAGWAVEECRSWLALGRPLGDDKRNPRRRDH